MVLNVNRTVRQHSGRWEMAYVEPSPAHDILAFAYDQIGNERLTIQLYNISSKSLLCEGLALETTAYYSLRWMRSTLSNGHGWIVYNTVDELGVPRGVERFSIDWCADSARMSQYRSAGKFQGERIYWESDQSLTADVHNTNNNQFVVVMSRGQLTSQPLLVLESSNLMSPFAVPLLPAVTGMKVHVEYNKDYFYLRTNADGSDNFQIIRIHVNNTLLSQAHSSDDISSIISPSNLTIFSQTIVTHSSTHFLEKMEMFDQHIVIWLLNAGTRTFMIINLNSIDTHFTSEPNQPYSAYDRSFQYTVPRGKPVFLSPGTIANMESRLARAFFTQRLIFSNASCLQPLTIYSMDMNNPADVHLLGGSRFTRMESQSHEYHTSRLWISNEMFFIEPNVNSVQELPLALQNKLKEDSMMAENCTDPFIPVDLFYRQPLSVYSAETLQGMLGNNRRPVLASAYGAYQSIAEAVFDSSLYALVDRGIIFASIHPRGDGDMGYWWYKSALTTRKTRTFADVETVLKVFVREGITHHSQIGLKGRSAGGLVAGIAVNNFEVQFLHHSTDLNSATAMIDTNDTALSQRLVAFVVAQVPFVDVINDMMDPTVPWTAYEWTEWGDPFNKSQYQAMVQYSPYDNVQPQASTPDLFVTAGREDSRVPYYEPLKWVAKLRAQQQEQEVGTHRSEILFHMYDGGHFSGTDTVDKVLWMSLLLEKLGVESIDR